MINYLSGVEYGNDVPVQGWIEIEADYDDWCRLGRQPFYRELMEYLQQNGIQARDPWLDFPQSTRVSTSFPRYVLLKFGEWISRLAHRGD